MKPTNGDHGNQRSAVVRAARVNLGENAGRGVDPPVGVQAPAGEGAVHLQLAGVQVAGADLGQAGGAGPRSC